jgi:hypothetical protein
MAAALPVGVRTAAAGANEKKSAGTLSRRTNYREEPETERPLMLGGTSSPSVGMIPVKVPTMLGAAAAFSCWDEQGHATDEQSGNHRRPTASELSGGLGWLTTPKAQGLRDSCLRRQIRFYDTVLGEHPC